jgi:hypothetical protein
MARRKMGAGRALPRPAGRRALCRGRLARGGGVDPGPGGNRRGGREPRSQKVHPTAGARRPELRRAAHLRSRPRARAGAQRRSARATGLRQDQPLQHPHLPRGEARARSVAFRRRLVEGSSKPDLPAIQEQMYGLAYHAAALKPPANTSPHRHPRVSSARRSSSFAPPTRRVPLCRFNVFYKAKPPDYHALGRVRPLRAT